MTKIDKRPTTVQELLDSPDKWCKGAFAQTAIGQDTDELHDNACRWCLIGALRKVYGLGNISPHRNKLDEAIRVVFPQWDTEITTIPAFNDHRTTTFDHIRQVVEYANI